MCARSVRTPGSQLTGWPALVNGSSALVDCTPGGDEGCNSSSVDLWGDVGGEESWGCAEGEGRG